MSIPDGNDVPYCAQDYDDDVAPPQEGEEEDEEQLAPASATCCTQAPRWSGEDDDVVVDQRVWLAGGRWREVWGAFVDHREGAPACALRIVAREIRPVAAMARLRGERANHRA